MTGELEPSRADRMAGVHAALAANPNLVGDMEAARERHDALKSFFSSTVEALERIAPRAAVVSALGAALRTERTVDEMIAAADAEDRKE